jgi:hypothetical protein
MEDSKHKKVFVPRSVKQEMLYEYKQKLLCSSPIITKK